jgi:hypothetical protein
MRTPCTARIDAGIKVRGGLGVLVNQDLPYQFVGPGIDRQE